MQASVLIDTHPCRPDEVRAMAMALALARDVSLGKLDEFRPYLSRLLGQELEPERIRQLDHLLRQMNRVLWTDRTPWTIYELSRASFPSVLIHGLERRLNQDAEEVRRVNRHLHELGYHPFIGEFRDEYRDRNENEESQARKQ